VAGSGGILGLVPEVFLLPLEEDPDEPPWRVGIVVGDHTIF